MNKTALSLSLAVVGVAFPAIRRTLQNARKEGKLYCCTQDCAWVGRRCSDTESGVNRKHACCIVYAPIG